MLISTCISKRASSAWAAWLDFLFPRTCIRCGRLIGPDRAGFLCPACRDRIIWVREPLCQVCGVPIFGKVRPPKICPACLEQRPVFERARSLFLYRSAGARLVHVLKYEQGLWLRDEIACLLGMDPLWRAYFEDAILVPVPLHPGKLRARGYNQADLIARAVQAAFPGTGLQPCLQRIRRTPSQTFLSRQERLKNLSGAFACPRPPPGGSRLILVDDVLTTGATLNAAAQALKQAGLPPPAAFTLAHG